jgi:hypothetical protein
VGSALHLVKEETGKWRERAGQMSFILLLQYECFLASNLKPLDLFNPDGSGAR